MRRRSYGRGRRVRYSRRRPTRGRRVNRRGYRM